MPTETRTREEGDTRAGWLRRRLTHSGPTYLRFQTAREHQGPKHGLQGFRRRISTDSADIGRKVLKLVPKGDVTLYSPRILRPRIFLAAFPVADRRLLSSCGDPSALIRHGRDGTRTQSFPARNFIMPVEDLHIPDLLAGKVRQACRAVANEPVDCHGPLVLNISSFYRAGSTD